MEFVGALGSGKSSLISAILGQVSTGQYVACRCFSVAQISLFLCFSPVYFDSKI